MNKRIRFITEAAMIAALYVALTYVSAVFGLSSGAIQCRISEALCVLPVFTFSAVPGVTVGCLIANLVTTGSVYDIVFGSLATLIGALGAYFIRRFKYAASVPTIVSNALIIPIVLRLSGISSDAILYLVATVGLGEVISCGVLGTILIPVISRYSGKLFGATQASFK